tara:strand:+ start:217 stop:510 length:294 start_codon:yes stop_codon:yes gene_type:complete
MKDRFTNVKHAEFELIMNLLRKVDIQGWAEEGVPGIRSPKDADDKVALKRARTAVQNIRAVLLNMASKRIKSLPYGHEYEGWEMGDDLIPPAHKEWD